MSRDDHRRYDALLKELRIERENHRPSELWKVYSRDFVLGVIALFLPWGWEKAEVIPHSDPWNVIVGWVFLTIPLCFGIRILWTFLRFKKWSVRSRVLVALAMGIGFILLAMKSYEGFVVRQAGEQQVDAANHLIASATTPPNGDMWQTVFAFRNEGKSDIYPRSINCRVHLITTEKFIVVEGAPVANLEHLFPEDFVIRAGSDGQSDECLNGALLDLGGIVCADVTIELQYRLVSQPLEFRTKDYRFVATRDGGKVWYQQALGYQKSYCPRNDAK